MKKSKELLKRKIYLRILNDWNVFVDDTYLNHFIKNKSKMKMARELGWI